MRSELESPLTIRPYRESDRDGIIDLWNRCGLVVLWNDPDKDIDRKQKVQPDLFLVGVINEKIVVCAMASYNGHRGWVNYLAVAPEHQREGFGRLIMEKAEEELRKMGCPKINVQIRTSNESVIQFYESIGFSEDDVVSMGKRLVED